MPKISLTDFVDIATKAGSPKATKVLQVKARPEYEPAFDFYKILRESITEIHRTSGEKSEIDEVIRNITDKKKISNYQAVADGYKKWWGRKSFTWFTPPKSIYSHDGIDVIINPELGLEFGGQKHIVKLYFKSDQLSKFKVDTISYLMEISLRDKANHGELMSILDVRNSKLFSCDEKPTSLKAMVNAELSYISTLWTTEE